MFTVLGASGWLMIFLRLLYLVLRILPIIATFGVLSQKISSYWGRSFNISLLERFSHCIRWICSSRALSHALHCRDFLPVLKLRGGAGVPADRLLHLLPQLQWRDWRGHPGHLHLSLGQRDGCQCVGCQQTTSKSKIWNKIKIVESLQHCYCPCVSAAPAHVRDEAGTCGQHCLPHRWGNDIHEYWYFFFQVAKMEKFITMSMKYWSLMLTLMSGSWQEKWT